MRFFSVFSLLKSSYQTHKRLIVVLAHTTLILLFLFESPLFCFLILKKYNWMMDTLLNKFTNILMEQIENIAVIYVPLFLGGTLFALRKWGRPFYATAEVFFGMYGAGVTLLLLYKPTALPDEYQKLVTTTPYPHYVGLFSSIYVIVRGLDNWETWLKKSLAEPHQQVPLSRNVQT